jgi:pullulanase/glycogen debranching enzyme
MRLFAVMEANSSADAVACRAQRMQEHRMHIWPGYPYPLGATYDGTGVNSSLFSEVAERVQLCLFDGPWEPEEGQRCTPAKLLRDPYAKAIEGQVQRLGVTAVELMPGHQFVQDARLLERGLRNY